MSVFVQCVYPYLTTFDHLNNFIRAQTFFACQCGDLSPCMMVIVGLILNEKS
jgi:hypothetical protein